MISKPSGKKNLRCPLCFKVNIIYCDLCIRNGNFGHSNNICQLFYEKKEIIFSKKIEFSNLRDKFKLDIDKFQRNGHNLAHYKLYGKYDSVDILLKSIDFYEKQYKELQERIITLNHHIILQRENVKNMNTLLNIIHKDSSHDLLHTDELFKQNIKISKAKSFYLSSPLKCLQDIFPLTKEISSNKKYNLLANSLSQHSTQLIHYKINGITYNPSISSWDAKWPTTEKYEKVIYKSPGSIAKVRQRRYTTDDKYSNPISHQPAPIISHRKTDIIINPAIHSSILVEMASEALAITIAPSSTPKHIVPPLKCSTHGPEANVYIETQVDTINVIPNSTTLDSYFSKEILACLTYMTQLMKVMAEILDLPLPYNDIFSHINTFCVDKIADPPRGYQLVEELFLNINYMCRVRVPNQHSMQPSVQVPMFSDDFSPISDHHKLNKSRLAKLQNYNPLRNLYMLLNVLIDDRTQSKSSTETHRDIPEGNTSEPMDTHLPPSWPELDFKDGRRACASINLYEHDAKVYSDACSSSPNDTTPMECLLEESRDSEPSSIDSDLYFRTDDHVISESARDPKPYDLCIGGGEGWEIFVSATCPDYPTPSNKCANLNQCSNNYFPSSPQVFPPVTAPAYILGQVASSVDYILHRSGPVKSLSSLWSHGFGKR